MSPIHWLLRPFFGYSLWWANSLSKQIRWSINDWIYLLCKHSSTGVDLPKILEEKLLRRKRVVIADESFGVSQVLGECARAALPESLRLCTTAHFPLNVIWQLFNIMHFLRHSFMTLYSTSSRGLLRGAPDSFTSKKNHYSCEPWKSYKLGHC